MNTTTEATIANNKLIAEFMQLEQHGDYFHIEDENLMEITGCEKGEVTSLGYLFTPELMKFHTSWDWLMPVVEKIEQLSVSVLENEDELHDKRKVEYQFTVCIENEQCMIHVDIFPQYYGTDTDFFKTYDCCNRENGVTKIQATYKAVVEFIKWFNENANEVLKATAAEKK